MQNTLCVFFVKCFLFCLHLQEDSPEKKQWKEKDIILCLTKSTTSIWLRVTGKLINSRSAMQSYLDLNNPLVNQFSNHPNWYKSTNILLKSAFLFFFVKKKVSSFFSFKKWFLTQNSKIMFAFWRRKLKQITSDKCNAIWVHLFLHFYVAIITAILIIF